MRVASLIALIGVQVLAGACAQPINGGDSGTVGVEESGFVEIGGIEQFVTIRGKARSNPALLVVHGGPGDVQSPFVTEYAPYETLFTVVQWDQRGAGRTYGRYGDDTPDLTLEQLVSDSIELSHYLKEHLSDPDIILLGHSWGSVIGVEMAEREPDLFTAYVGTGQVASWDSGVRYQYELVRSKANEPGNQAMLDVLEEIGEFDPTDVQDFLAVNRFLRQYLGPADADWLDGIGARTAQAVSPDIANAIGGGMNLSGRTLFSTQIREDLVSTANSFEIPFIVIQGEEDLFTPTPVAVQYFDAVSAPRKEMRIISGAGHFALVTHTEEFVAVITEAVIRNRD